MKWTSIIVSAVLTLSFCPGSSTAFARPSAPRFQFLPSHQHTFISTRPTLWSAKEASESSVIPDVITSKALAQLYPALAEHKAKVGNPNIPLGTTEGRQCNLIRRMHTEGKLTEAEVEFLTDFGFIFHTLEDVYEHVDFEEIFPRLEQYKKEHGNLDIKKKYEKDPLLGAWVTGVRRLGKANVSADHASRLDDIGFMWESSRQCGSKFMMQYRAIQQRLQDEKASAVFGDPEVQKYIRAQKEAYKRDTLSETRVEYMTRLVGEEWWTK